MKMKTKATKTAGFYLAETFLAIASVILHPVSIVAICVAAVLLLS